MPIGAAIGGAVASVGGSAIAAGSSSSNTNKAVAAETAANQAAIGEQQREFNTNQQNLAPWLSAGQGALSGQLDLLGLGGHTASPGTVDWQKYISMQPDVAADYQLHQDMTPEQYGQYHYAADGSKRDLTPYTTGAQGALSSADAQQQAITGLQNGPLYQSLYKNGQDTILNNAAATGGLRGGNTQRSLANFGSDTLTQVIQNQLANLGGISSTGQGAAGTLGNLGASSSNNISALLSQNGQAQSGGILANAGIQNNAINGISKSLGGLFATPGLFGSGSSSISPNIDYGALAASAGQGLPSAANGWAMSF